MRLWSQKATVTKVLWVNKVIVFLFFLRPILFPCSSLPSGPWSYATAVAQSLTLVRPLVTPWTAEGQAPLSFIISWNLLRSTSIESVMLSNCLIICHFRLLLPSVFPNIKGFSNELALMQRAKVLKTACISWFSETFLTIGPILLPFLYPLSALKTSSSLCPWQLLRLWLDLRNSVLHLPPASS